MTGTRILGSPIGNSDFVKLYQNKSIQKLRTAAEAIHNLVPDPHIAITLYKFSIQHYTTHLLFTDLIHHQNTSSATKHYSTPFTSTIKNITKNFIHKLSSNPDNTFQSTLPKHAWLIATTPTGLGGIGFQDIETKALRTFVTPFAHTIRIMKQGIRPLAVPTHSNLHLDIHITLPQYVTATYKGWKSSTLDVFQKYRKLTCQYIEGTSPPHPHNNATYTIESYTYQAPLFSTAKKIQKEIAINRLKTTWPQLSPNIQKHMPSTLSALTSIPFGQSTRTDHTNHFTTDEFKIFLQRKLRLPLWPPPPTTCTCGKAIDKYGDHFFTCKQNSKKDLHDRMRDSIYTICREAFPLVSNTAQQDVHRELTHVFEKATQMRPGDVVIKHPLNSDHEPHATTLIDVTIIPPYKFKPSITTYEDIASAMKTHHQTQEHQKFKIDDHAKSNSTSEELSAELIKKRYRMLPFTIDHQGMLGPIATEFLLGHKNAIFTISPNEYDKKNTTKETKELIKLSMHKNRHENILTKANSLWKLAYGSQWYTNTYHAQTPRQWAKQVLGNTFSIQSSKHIIRALNKLNMQTPNTPKTPKAQCSSMNLHTPTQYAVRSLRYTVHSSV